MTTQKTALVLGATGGIGGEVARTLLARGWHVRALHRNPQPGRADGFDWRRGDAMSPADVIAAAEGAALIVHAVNPPGYRNWAKLVLPMLDSTHRRRQAPRRDDPAAGHRLQLWPRRLPDPDRGLAAAPAPPARARSASRWRRACAPPPRPRPGAGGARRRLLRPARRQQLVFARPGQAGAAAPGHHRAGRPRHRPPVGLPARRGRDDGAPRRGGPAGAFRHLPHGRPVGPGRHRDDRRRSATVLGDPDLPVRRFPWPLVRLAQPVVPFFRELAEMRYLWQQPIRMDNRRLVEAIGAEPHTPLGQAVRATLAGLGCLPAAEAPRATAETARPKAG